MSITGQAQELVKALVDLDVRATMDPSNIQPPCILVEPSSGAFNFLGGDCQLTYRFNLLVILPGVRIVDSLPNADQLITKMLEAGMPLSEWNPIAVPWGDGSVPALSFPVEIAAPWAD
jgi:hypothetical protein